MVQILIVNPDSPEAKYIGIAAEALRHGNLVAFPTETVYGLGANALDIRAVARIFEAKGRPSDDPLIVHLAAASQLPFIAAEIPPVTWQLAEAFWPGPLTLILPKRPEVPNLVTAGRGTVAMRVPAHPVALALLKAADVFIAAPSANRFGHISPTSAKHVLSDLGDRIDVLVDGGETSIGIESTVLDLTAPIPVILRPGGITREMLVEILGNVIMQSGADGKGPQISPGRLPQHYSPHAELIFLLGPKRSSALAKMRQIAEKELENGRSVGILALDEDFSIFEGLSVQSASLGSESDLWQAANRLYAAMRSLDDQHVDIILARDLGEHGPGLAIRDRLHRAARKIIT